MPSMKSTRSRAGGADRGGIRKRGPTRTDRDGDMEMDGPGRGKRTRGDTGRATGGGRAQTRDKTVDAIQQAISSSTKESQANIRQSKGAARASLEQFRVSGWKQSKAASNRDGGVESLVAFLERRLNAITKSGPRAKITKVCFYVARWRSPIPQPRRPCAPALSRYPRRAFQQNDDRHSLAFSGVSSFG